MKALLGSTRHVLLLFAIALSTGALAQEYPNKPVRIIITYPAGAASDTIARLLGAKLADALGQQFVVENRPGGNTIIGAEAAAKAPGDGYTLLMGQVQNLAIVPELYHSKMPFDTLTDFVPVSFIGYAPLMLVVNPSLPVNSVKELIAYAKANPTALRFPSSGSGGSTHLAGELFKSMADVNMQHIPYQGGAAPVAAIISGQVEVGFDSTVQLLPHVKAGKLRALAVTGAKRSSAAPDIPTVAEAGLPGYEVAPWFGIVAPKGTSPEIIAKLHTEIAKAVQLPDVKERFAALGIDTVTMSPAEFGASIRAERAKWAKVIKTSGAKVD